MNLYDPQTGDYHPILKRLKEVNVNDTPYPTVFYVGMGKAGSASLFYGIQNATVAHWHNTEYFCRIHNNYDLPNNGKSIYDFIHDLGELYSFRPIVIESFRDPIAQRLSWYFQVFKGITSKQAIHAMQSDFWMYSRNFEIEVEIDYFNFDYIELKFDEIGSWQKQLAEYGLEYLPKHENKRANIEYDKAREQLKLTEDKLRQIYFSTDAASIFTEEEIEKFIEIWKR